MKRLGTYARDRGGIGMRSNWIEQKNLGFFVSFGVTAEGTQTSESFFDSPFVG
jgi:hypothetical protein